MSRCSGPHMALSAAQLHFWESFDPSLVPPDLARIPAPARCEKGLDQTWKLFPWTMPRVEPGAKGKGRRESGCCSQREASGRRNNLQSSILPNFGIFGTSKIPKTLGEEDKVGHGRYFGLLETRDAQLVEESGPRQVNSSWMQSKQDFLVNTMKLFPKHTDFTDMKKILVNVGRDTFH